MDEVKKFLQVEGVIGHGAFGRVLVTSPLQNQVPLRQSQPQVHNGTLKESNGALDHAANNETDMIKKDQYSFRPLTTTPTRLSNGSPEPGSSPRYALKCVHPLLRPQRLASELSHLKELGGKCNVVQMLAAHFDERHGSLYIVMELIDHDKFVDFVGDLQYNEITLYMENLLIALEHVHAHNIIHRDIKPGNFLFNRREKKFLLVDFGLAQKIRARSNLFGTRPSQATATPSSISSLNASATHASSASRRLMAPLFPEAMDNRKDNQTLFNGHTLIKPTTPFKNFKSTHIFPQSPARHYINLNLNDTPTTPNVATKRQLEAYNPNDFNQMLKKLRVSNNDDQREPVKLTVGAYESPVTHNDSIKKRPNTAHKFSTPNVPSRSASSRRCDCIGKGKTCTICTSRPDSAAPRSGTPGYKAPEILLRYPNQTTAIDIWSAGVIFLCLLCGHSPFFRNVDDTIALAEIITLLGSDRVAQAAKTIGIRLNVEPKREPMDLSFLCVTMRGTNADKRSLKIPKPAFDLLSKMLDPCPTTRITASEALRHEMFKPDDGGLNN